MATSVDVSLTPPNCVTFALALLANASMKLVCPLTNPSPIATILFFFVFSGFASVGVVTISLLSDSAFFFSV